MATLRLLPQANIGGYLFVNGDHSPFTFDDKRGVLLMQLDVHPRLDLKPVQSMDLGVILAVDIGDLACFSHG